MRIAVLATNRNPLAAPFAGGQESLTAALVAGFRRQGHHVVLFAARGTDSSLCDELVVYPQLPELSVTARLDPQVPEEWFLADHHAFTFAMSQVAARAAAGSLDVVANHSLHHMPMSLSKAAGVPVVTTLHTPPFPWMELGAALADDSARYVAVSQALAAQWTTLGAVDVVRNGVDEGKFAVGPGSEAGALVWVGRVTPEKAPHVAVTAASRTGRPLTLVGPISDGDYFTRVLKPLLTDGVSYVGALSGAELARVVGSSAVALMTPRWEEPFGLVAVEAAMTGTPVAAFARGGVSEAVRPGMGVLVHESAQMADEQASEALALAIDKAAVLPRDDVRAAAVSEFSLRRCVREHLEVLEVAAHEGRRQKGCQ